MSEGRPFDARVDASSRAQVNRDAMYRTARIVIDGHASGTGVLVGEDLLLTASHVIYPNGRVERGPVPGAVAEFDYFHEPSRGVRAPAEIGRRVTIVESRASSPPTRAELDGRYHDHEHWNASVQELDYVLLRLERPVFRDRPDGRPRLFYPLRRDAFAFVRDAILTVFQHPDGRLQQVSHATEPHVNALGTRVRCRSNTNPGSSGGPIVDDEGRLVALHNGGGPEYNQGVVVTAIARDLVAKGIALPEPPQSIIEGMGSPLYGTPRDASVHFVGRDAQLDELEQALRSGKSVRVAASVEGLAGIGKTELALQLVHRLAATNAYPGGIYWLDAGNVDLTTAWATAIADALGIGGQAIEERAAESVRTVSHARAEALVVLDNVVDWTATSKPAPLPTGSHVRYLVTTRQHNLDGTGFRHVSVGILEPEAAERLLVSAAERDLADLPGVRELLDHLAGHALAIELAGAFLCEFPEETPKSYLEALAAPGEAGDDVEAEVRDRVRYGRTVTQTLQTVWDRLDDATRDSWRIAACLEPDFATPAFAEAMGLSRKDRANLRRLHLIESDAHGASRMHRLVAEFGRRAGSRKELAAAQEAFVRGAMRLVQVDRNDALGFRVYLADRAHVDAALDQAKELLGGDEPSVELADFCQDVALLREAVGEFREARELLRLAIAIGEKAHDADDPQLATYYSHLALVERDLGNLSNARELWQRALAIGEKAYDADDPKLGTHYSNLAMAEQDLGNLTKARELSQRAFAIDENAYPADHPTLAIYYWNQAVVEQDLGNLTKARELLQRAIAIDEKAYDADHPTLAKIYSTLATFEKDLGNLTKARELLERAIAIEQKAYPADHPTLAKSSSSLALVEQDLGNLTRARELLLRAIAIEEKAYGADDPKLAANYSTLAMVERALGSLEKARELLLRAIAIGEKAYDADDPMLAAYYSNLGLVERDLGSPTRARELLQHASAIDEKAYGADHPRLASYYSILGLVEQTLGNLTKAHELLHRAIAIDEKAYAADHPTLATCYSNLAMIERDLGNPTKARELLHRAIAIAEKAYDADHPTLATYYSSLAIVEQTLGS